MIEKYFQLYDSLVKEFHLPEDKAKEMIRVIYESSGTPMENKKQPVLLSSPENIYKPMRPFKEWLLNEIRWYYPLFIQAVLSMLLLFLLFRYVLFR